MTNLSLSLRALLLTGLLGLLLAPLSLHAADVDADGMDDAWETAYGLNPANPADAALDPDEDGLTNLDEYDLATNPADPDTDGDTIDDGTEVIFGMDPLTEALQATDYLYEVEILEDAENGDAVGWDIYSAAVPGTITNEVDPDDATNRVIRLTGDDFDTGFRYTFAAVDTAKFKLQWRMKFGCPFVIYIPCQTTLGFRYLYYSPHTYTSYAAGSYIRHSLGTGVGVGSWATIRRDLAADVALEPGNELLSVGAIMMRGYGLLDDLRLYAYADSDGDLLPDTAEIAAGLDPTDPTDAGGDSDGDTISDLDEIILTGTSIASVDTDNDGLTDADELFEIGTDPLYADTDEDGLGDGAEILVETDPFVADTDGDGLLDGAEVAAGMDPLTEALQGTGYLYEKLVLEDAEDGDTLDWDTYDNDPVGTIVNQADPNDPDNLVIALDGDRTGTGHRFTLPEPETRRFKLQWRMDFDVSYTVYVQCSTALGLRYIQYIPADQPPYLLGKYAIHGLGPVLGIGTWGTVRRDLFADLQAAEPTNELLSVNAILIRGIGRIDDIALYAYVDGDRDLLPDAVEVAAGLDPSDPSDASGDVDGDGIPDLDEVILTGTDAANADTDGDALFDGDEILLGTDPFAPDTDADTVSDGQEVLFGMDPLVPALEADGYRYEARVLEDAEDGDTLGWDVYYAAPGTITNATDPQQANNRIIQLDPDTTTGFRFTIPGSVDDWTKLSWRMLGTDNYRVYIGCTTTLGHRYLKYMPGTFTPYLIGEYIHHPFGSLGNGKWDTLLRDAATDLTSVEPGNALLSIDAILFTGVSSVDDIATYTYIDLDGDTLPDTLETSLGLDPSDAVDAAADLDGDGLTNAEEFALGTGIATADSDADGLVDGDEVATWRTNPFVGDTDEDGLSDGDEVAVTGTDPLAADTDGDGLNDGHESLVQGTDPLAADTDADGLSDGNEVAVTGTDPLAADTDEDGLSDGDEVAVTGTDPLAADTDEDGLSDGDEVAVTETDPLVADTDEDGLSDGDESLLQLTDPLVADTDEDGLSDGDEVLAHGTDPLVADTDEDGLSDGDEVTVTGTDPLVVDTDEDGLTDGEEALHFLTDPTDPDTDADTVPDGVEVLSGMDPLTPALEGDGFRYEYLLLEDAEDGDLLGWDIYDAAEPGTITNIVDPADPANRVILLDGAEFNTGYRFTLPEPDLRRFRLQWRMNFTTSYVIYVNCLTSEGQCYLQYVPGSVAPYARGDNYVIYPLLPALGAGQWGTVRRDLMADLQAVRPGVELLEVSTVLVRGRGMLDDLALYAYPDTDRDLLPDTIETAWGLDPADAADGATDGDNDLLSNADEFIHGTAFDQADTDGDLLADGGEIILGLDPLDPTDADGAFLASVATPAVEPGLLAAYYKGYFRTLPHFDTIPHYGADVLPMVNMPPSFGEVLTSDLYSQVAAVIQGWINVPADGWYTFYLTHDDGAVLSVGGHEVINGDHYVSGAGPYAEARGGIALAAGMHPIRLEYFNLAGRSALVLEWAPTGQDRQVVPAAVLSHDPTLFTQLSATDDRDGDGLYDVDEYAAGTTRVDSDSDDDGISDGDEVHLYGTDPLSGDSDGDGVGDYEEVAIAHTDPLKIDFDGTLTDVASLAGNAATVLTGTWDLYSGVAISRDRQGSLAYTLAVPEAGTYAIEVRGTQDNSLTSQGDFVLDGSINGAWLGRTVLHGPAGTIGLCRFYTSRLAAGNHTFKLDWRNGEINTFLRITAVTLQQVGSPDSDGNGVPDWLDSRLANCTDNIGEQTLYSAVSPYCLEGTAPIRELVAARSSFVPDDPTLPVDGDGRLINVVLPAVGDAWYTNVPLSPTAATELSLGWEGGALARARTVVWSPTNALQTEAMTLRVGDSLLLTGRRGNGKGPETGNVVPDDTDAVRIEVEGNVLEATPGTAVPYRFDNAGTVVVTTTFAPNSAHPTVNEMTVTVVGCAFNGTPALVVGYQRIWDNPAIPDLATLAYDRQFRLDEFALADGGRQLNMITDVDLPGHMTARLGQDGPILASTRLDTVTYDTSAETRFVVVKEYSDVSQLIEGRMTLGYVPEDLEVHMHIFAGGVTFEDGTIDRVFTAEDFSEIGELRFRFIRAEDGYTAACHYVHFYQNGHLIKPH